MDRRVLIFAAISLILGSLVAGAVVDQHVIRSDGVGYYAYLPALFIDHDLGMNRLVERLPDDGAISDSLHLVPATGAYLDKYPAGMAVMTSPFFLVAHAIARVCGLRADGFSSIYQLAVQCAAITYGLAGLMAMRALLLRFSERTELALCAILFGTPLFHYLTYDACFSHACSWFLVAAFALRTVQWVDDGPRLRTTFELALIAALIPLVRPTNAIALLFFPLYFVLRGRRDLRVLVPLALAAAVCFAACGGLQIAYFLRVTGKPFVFSYTGESFHFLAPKPLNVLFGLKKGLFFWSPVLLFATIGLWRSARAIKWACLVPLGLELWVVASWWSWWYGGGFGHRAFVEFLPFFGVGLVRTNRVLVAAAIAWSMIGLVLYWARVIPYEGFELGR